jgi:hypothetical protein
MQYIAISRAPGGIGKQEHGCLLLAGQLNQSPLLS